MLEGNDLSQTAIRRRGWPWTTSRRFSANCQNSAKFPKISVITPSYNQGKFLEATIRSVLLQGYPNLEYIIIDGGSTDQSVEIIKKYESHLNYWISEPDRGQTDAINKGIQRSTGEIIGWLNSDDLYTRGAFNQVVKAFRSSPDCILVHGNRILLNEHGCVTGWVSLPPFNPNQTSFNVCSETAFWKRSAMEEIGALKTELQFAMDLEFFGRLYLHGKFKKLNRYLGYFRCYDSNKSSTISHVGQEESIAEWHRVFGGKLMIKGFRQNYWWLVSDLIKHPSLIAWPYLSYKMAKLIQRI